MTLWEALQTAWKRMSANKLRSTLTMLGVIIGVAAIILMIGVSLILTGCAEASPSGGPAPAATSALTQDYQNAIPARSQLVIGTFRLDDSPLAITPEQAAKLVPLW